MLKLKNENIKTIESIKNKKIKVDGTVILSMFVTLILMIGLFMSICFKVVKYKQLTESLKWNIILFLIFTAYAVCSEFIYQWHENLKITLCYDIHTNNIKNMKITYNILPLFTNNNKVVLDIKEIKQIKNKKNKLIIYGTAIKTIPMKRQKKYNKIIIKKSEFNFDGIEL